MPTTESPGSLLRIGEMAQLLGLTTRTLRYWEKRSLLPAARRTPGGFRLYGRRDLEVARGIGRLKQAGLGLAEIRELQSDFAHAGTHLDRRIQQIRGAIEEKQQLLSELICSRELLHSCNGCGGKPYDHECVRCLNNLAAKPMPDTLVSILAHCTESSDWRSP